jgi:hypothetical protein
MNVILQKFMKVILVTFGAYGISLQLLALSIEGQEGEGGDVSSC